jgi:hypothetical protein
MQFTPDEPVEPVEEDSYFVYGFDMKQMPEDVEVTGLIIVLRVSVPGLPYPLLLAKESSNIADWEARSMLGECAANMFQSEYEIEVEG